jgi:hypothetical protein
MVSNHTKKIVQTAAGVESGAELDRFHDFFDVLFRAVLDLLELFVLAEFSKASFNHLEEFVDVTHEPCEFVTDLSRVQFSIRIRDGFTHIKTFRVMGRKGIGALYGPS